MLLLLPFFCTLNAEDTKDDKDELLLDNNMEVDEALTGTVPGAVLFNAVLTLAVVGLFGAVVLVDSLPLLFESAFPSLATS